MSDITESDAPSGRRQDPDETEPETTPVPGETDARAGKSPATAEREIGGPAGPEPTRYGDWEKKGRCIDF